jgi:hypothetical protein
VKWLEETMSAGPSPGLGHGVEEMEELNLNQEKRAVQEKTNLEDEVVLEDPAWQEEQPRPAARNRATTYMRRLEQDRIDMLELVDRKSSPRALKELLRPSPSLHLEQALSEANDPRLLPRRRPQSVHDLSYRNAKTLAVFNVNGCRPSAIDGSVSLQSLTAKFIREALRPGVSSDDFMESEMSASSVGSNNMTLNAEELQTLHSSGYEEMDARTWADILLEPNTYLATKRLAAPGTPTTSQTGAGKSTPWFVMNFLLRREKVPAEALRLILNHAWRTLEREEQKRITDATSTLQPPSPRMIMAICVRLVRHARDVWPQALPNITKLFSTYLLESRAQYHKAIDKPMSSSLLQQLTFKCNRMLSQLSLNGKTYPVLSATHQQRAQFDLIRKMMQYQPGLRINQEGHRALTKTLLLLKKTPQERDWAMLQARTWPPFKISQTGLDEPKDRKYGTSTAGKSIEFMRAYGYSMRTWDLIAQVYTGWNPDGSPAIQRRALTPAVPTSFGGEPEPSDLHAAIVTSTRTLPEAWSAFLKFDTPGGKWRAIHIAMLKKLLMEEKQKNRFVRPRAYAKKEQVLAGDGIELLPEPTSPLEVLYLPSEPPSLEELFDSLVDRGFPVWGGMMCMLLENSPSFKFGLKVWNSGKFLKSEYTSRAVWSQEHLLFLSSAEQRELDSLPVLPNDLVTAFITWVSAFPHSISDLAFLDRHDLMAGGWRLRANHSLVYAYRLLVYYKTTHIKAWNSLLEALTDRTAFRYAISRHDRTRERFWPLVAWAMTGNVLRSMKSAGAVPDHMTFQHLCDIAMNAGVTVQLHNLDQEDTRLVGFGDQVEVEKEFVEAALLFSQGPSILRRQFARLVGLDKDRHDDHPNMPSHLAIPKAAVLHKYVRALGILGDHEGIYSLVRWMVDASTDLHELQETQVNGRYHLRKLIVALRVWLECPSRDFVLSEGGIRLGSASNELVELARQEVESVKLWGGWPSDAAVEAYCSRSPNYML